LRMCRAWAVKIAAKDGPRCGSEQVCPSAGHCFKLGDGLTQG
jgi:hypothetical protein